MKEIAIKCYSSGRAKVRTKDVHVENENLATQIKIDFTETGYENYEKGVDLKTKQNLLRYFLGRDPVVIKELEYENTIWGEMVITPFVFSEENNLKARYLTDYSITIQRRDSLAGGAHGSGDAIIELKNILQLHIEDFNNPHQLTAEDIHLGNVQNYGIAIQEEMEADDDKVETLTNEKYVTPQRVRSTFISFGDLNNENSRIRSTFYTKDEIDHRKIDGKKIKRW